jgi:hypothetical protein
MINPGSDDGELWWQECDAPIAFFGALPVPQRGTLNDKK